MKRDLIIKAALFCTLAIVAIPDRLAAQGQNDNQGQSQNNGSGHHSQYRLIDLGTLGGPQSYIPEGAGITDARLLNNKGSIIGLADTSNPDPFPDFCWVDDCFAAHAFVGGSKGKKDLGVLIGGASSDTSWIADNGVISGDSQNGKIDPLIPGFPEIHAVLWRDGLIDLGTLEGGNESISMSVNSDAKVVGFALNGVADVNSMVGLGYQARAFLWQDGAMQDLGTLGSGTDAIGALINERGQVVGWSYTSSDPSDICTGVYGFALSTGSFLWEQGKGMTDLGGLGGTCTVAFDLNQRGQVVGQSWLAGDLTGHAFRWDSENGLVDLGTVGGGDFSSARAINNKGQAVGGSYLSGNVQIHAALWTGNTATDLGALDSDQCAYAFSINAVGQVVGASGTTNCESTRAFLWEPGSSMVDLNSLVAPNSNFHLAGAAEINDRGEIAGVGVLPNGDQHAVLLVPCASDDQSGCAKGEEITAGGASLSTVHAPQRSHGISSSNSVRRMFRLRTGLAPHLPNLSGTDGVVTHSVLTDKPDNRFEVTDRSSTIEINPLRITSGAPSSGTVGKLYDLRCSQIICTPLLAGFPVTATGGVRPYSWSWTPQKGSSLPPGLRFPSTQGLGCLIIRPPAICGTPTEAGTYEVVITVKDSESPPKNVSANYTMHIFP